MEERSKLNLRSRRSPSKKMPGSPMPSDEHVPAERLGQTRGASGSRPTKLTLRSSSNISSKISQTRTRAAPPKQIDTDGSKDTLFDSTGPVHHKKTGSLKKHLFIGAGGVAVVAIFAAVLQFIIKDSSTEPKDDAVAVQGVVDQEQQPILLSSFEDAETGLVLDYNLDFTQEPLSDNDKQDGLLARLTSQSPPAVISVRQETGLRAVTARSNTKIESLLRTNVDKSLPDRYPGFIQESGSSIDQMGQDRGFERIFTYTGPSGEIAKQKLLVLIKDDDTAIYISMQTTEALYDTVSTGYFDGVQASVTLE